MKKHYKSVLRMGNVYLRMEGGNLRNHGVIGLGIDSKYVCGFLLIAHQYTLIASFGLGMEVVCGVMKELTELSWTQACHAVEDKYSLVE